MTSSRFHSEEQIGSLQSKILSNQRTTTKEEEEEEKDLSLSLYLFRSINIGSSLRMSLTIVDPTRVDDWDNWEVGLKSLSSLSNVDGGINSSPSTSSSNNKQIDRSTMNQTNVFVSPFCITSEVNDWTPSETINEKRGRSRRDQQLE